MVGLGGCECQSECQNGLHIGEGSGHGGLSACGRSPRVPPLRSAVVWGTAGREVVGSEATGGAKATVDGECNGGFKGIRILYVTTMADTEVCGYRGEGGCGIDASIA